MRQKRLTKLGGTAPALEGAAPAAGPANSGASTDYNSAYMYVILIMTYHALAMILYEVTYLAEPAATAANRPTEGALCEVRGWV